MIELKHLGKRYPGGQEALLDINLSIDKGEMVFLSGHSGAGKSTLLRLLALIERPTRGKISLNDKVVSNLPAHSIPYYRRNIGMIFQDHRLLPDHTIADNVALPLRISGVDQSVIQRRVDAALDKVGLLKRSKFMPIELSTGQQQRVGIARAVVSRPSILLADEPTGNLDHELSMDIMKLFQEFNDVGVTVIIASHDQAIMESFAKRQVELKEARLVSDSAAHSEEVDV